jgi:methylenetetrahydrofolate dehydrogenase (NADP+)/methenyltetrahydrofolate cyclohydrolase
MTAIKLDGREVSGAVRTRLAEAIKKLDFVPAIHFVRVGENPASVSYVRGKERLAASLGVASRVHVLPEDTSQAAVLAVVQDLNADDDVDGILVQLPLPNHLDPDPVLQAIDPAKDVDGLHPINVGRLWAGQDGLFPCTPLGLIAILKYYDIAIEGKNVVIVGRSNLVGKPAAALFLREHATVTVAHSRTRDLVDLCQRADILVAAVGSPAMITPDMVKAGAAVLDVGLSRVAGVIQGDVHPDVWDKAGYLTPMPGGTGRMTTAMLMENTYRAALGRRQEVLASFAG